jgi:Trk K+ transport system NAD-binding subunit
MQERNKQLELRNIDNTIFTEITLRKEDKAIGKSLREIASELPHDCILISIRRNDEVFMPHGDTIFLPKDKVTAYVKQNNIDTLKQSLQ